MNEAFVVRPISSGGWDYIAAALARLMAWLRATGHNHCLILDVSDEHYVQFIVRTDGRIWAESVGDVYLGLDGLCDEQRRTLALLGWNPPDAEGLGGGNCWHRWESGHDLDAATGVVMTCLDVFGAGRYTDVRVRVFEAVDAQ